MIQIFSSQLFDHAWVTDDAPGVRELENVSQVRWSGLKALAEATGASCGTCGPSFAGLMRMEPRLAHLAIAWAEHGGQP